MYFIFKTEKSRRVAQSCRFVWVLKHANLISFSPVKAKDLLASELLPPSFDWRDVDGVNFVSPIRDQEQCGSCYAFSTMGMFEARSRIQSNLSTHYILSTQDIVSCSEYSQGCEGGKMRISKSGQNEDES